jgi:hypothetical protein
MNKNINRYVSNRNIEHQNLAAIQLLLNKERNTVVKDYNSLFHLCIVIKNALNDIKNNLPLKKNLVIMRK